MSDKHIDLSTVFMYPKGEKPPREIKLSDCGPPMLGQDESSISFLYGNKHRTQGFKQIHDFAEAHGLSYEILDMRLSVSDSPREVSKENLGQQDVMSLPRLTTGVRELMYERMGISDQLSRGEQQQQLIDRLSNDPKEVAKLREGLEASQVPLVIHPVKLREAQTPIAVANLCKESSGRLVDVHCRTKPSIKVVNDLKAGPQDRDSTKETPENSPVSRNDSSKPRG